LIRELGQEHGIILSTHILPEIQEVCTQVQIIHQGQLVLNDSIEGLERNMKALSVLLKTQTTPELIKLYAIQGIHSIDDLGDNRYRVFHDQAANPASTLAEAIVAGGWGLLELIPEKRSMEQIFIEITQHSPQPQED
jgi:ABC-2 type transport system ATP-binding protein